MFQGTGSSVGKSVLVAGIARALTRRGLRVRPFKPQNMSNNAAVVPGGEIGRAQALQALACRTPATVEMNPVLLKPQSEIGSQLVLRGKVLETIKAREYQSRKATLMPTVLDCFHTLAAEADIVLVEGAGSASEVNLRQNDIANMGFAQAANIPVILIGDIDRGGVIASLVGTRTVLPEHDATRIKGFIVNKMRGDPTIFQTGMVTIAQHTTWHPIGLVPHLPALSYLPAEDAADLKSIPKSGPLKIAVPHLPMIANFDDLDPLTAEPDIALTLVPPGQPLPVADLIILPGSKATIADLKTLRAEGWDTDLLAHARRGGHILGICGGMQMLGHTITDPDGIEGPPGQTPGLGLLNLHTTLTTDKRLIAQTGILLPENTPIAGYEMHMGRSTGPDCHHPFAQLQDGPDGATSPNGRILGTYLHGLFSSGPARQTLLARLNTPITPRDHTEIVETTLDALADHLEQHLDLDTLLTHATSITR